MQHFIVNKIIAFVSCTKDFLIILFHPEDQNNTRNRKNIGIQLTQTLQKAKLLCRETCQKSVSGVYSKELDFGSHTQWCSRDSYLGIQALLLFQYFFHRLEFVKLEYLSNTIFFQNCKKFSILNIFHPLKLQCV